MEKGDGFEVKIFFFLEIIMIFGEKLQSMRSKPSFVFRDQFLRILANFKYPPLIGVTQNFIF